MSSMPHYGMRVVLPSLPPIRVARHECSVSTPYATESNASAVAVAEQWMCHYGYCISAAHSLERCLHHYALCRIRMQPLTPRSRACSALAVRSVVAVRGVDGDTAVHYTRYVGMDAALRLLLREIQLLLC